MSTLWDIPPCGCQHLAKHMPDASSKILRTYCSIHGYSFKHVSCSAGSSTDLTMTDRLSSTQGVGGTFVSGSSSDQC